MQNSNTKYRPDIDGLRAIAIVSVVFNHAGFSWFPGGYVGVDIFFVISGFLITSLLFNEVMATGRLHLGAFFARRVRRLMPAGLVVVAATLVLGAFFMLPGSNEQAVLARSAIAVAYFSSNFFFFKNSGGYFDTPSFGFPLLHTWSLAVEEQYYIVWPLLMILLFRLAGSSRDEGRGRKRLIWVLGGMLLISLALSIWTTPTYQKFAFYLLPTRIWEFAIGGILGLAGEAFYKRLLRLGEVLAVLGVSLIAYAIFAFDHQTPFPGWAAAIPVLGSTLLIAGMTASPKSIVRRLMATKPMVAIGLLSYSWYLWHWPLLSIYRVHHMGVQDIKANAVIVLVSLFLALLTFIGIERPIRVHRPWVFRSVRSTLFAGLGISLLMATMAGGLLLWRSHQKSTETYLMIKAGRDDLSPFREKCLVPHDKPFMGLPEDDCIHGPEPKLPKIVLWGDSHADDKMPMVMEAFQDVAVYQLTSPGCIPVIGYESRGMPGTTKICKEFNQLVLERILQLRQQGLKGVVISARWESYLWYRSISVADAGPGEQVGAAKLMEERVAMQADFDRLLTTLEDAGLRVVVLAPTPSLIFDAPQCVGFGHGQACDTPRAENEALLEGAVSALVEVVERHPNTRFVNPMDFFCDAKTCYAMKDGKFVFIDDDHVSAIASRELGRYLKPDLRWLLEGELRR